MNETVKRLMIIVIVALMVAGVWIGVSVLMTPKEITIGEFLETYESNVDSSVERTEDFKEITKIEISGYSTVVTYKDNTRERFYSYFETTWSRIDRVDDEVKQRTTAGGEPAFKPLGSIISMTDLNSGSWLNNVWLFVMLGMVVVTIIFISRQMNGGNSRAMNYGKVKTRQNETGKVKFTDVAGAEEEKEELSEIVEFLKDPKKFSVMGARIPRGVLLVGPPGTGKTLFAKAVAGEANVPFFSISGSDFVEMFVGVGAARVRDLFDVAKKNMPCIIFIDEIDAVGRQRGTGLGGGHDEREQTLNQLLVQMDGFETNTGIIVIAATNRADILDPALLRPGRFDRQIYVNVPDVRGREAIFKVHARNKPISPDINFKNLARMTAGFTGADIANLLNEAAILAVRSGRKVIIMKDIYEGINKVIAGPQKKSRLVTESDKRVTAYHESGHAILATELKHCDPVHEVTIIPRGMAAGYTMTRPETDDNHVSKNKLLEMITMMLGGRVAEELVIQDVCTGAENDLQRVSSIARKMVTEWGMSDLGPVYFGTSHEVFLGRDFQPQHTYSEEVAAEVDEEIRKIVDSCYKRAKEILTSKMTALENMARLLIERETILSKDVEMLVSGATVAEVEKAMDERTERENKADGQSGSASVSASEFVKKAEEQNK